MIDFSGYTRKSIQEDMLSQVPETIDTRQGSMIQTAVGPVAWYLEGLYMLLAQIQENAYPATAVGEYLDLIVQTRGIERKQATAAVREGSFDTEIPEGSFFKTINGASSLIFVSGKKLSASDGMFVYELTCTVPGAAGNSYTGALMPVTAISGLTSASIGKIREAGTEEESDSALRERYMATFDVTAFGGNISAYRNAILAIEGVGAVQVYPVWDGGGTVLCSILDDDLNPALPATVQNVQNTICPPEDGENVPSPDGYGMAPIGARVTITTATALTLNITCNVTLTAAAQGGTAAYQTQIEEKIQEYLDTVKETWGAPLKSHVIAYPVVVYISRIIYAILEIEDVVNVTDVKINGNDEDLVLTETAELQQIPVLGTVVLNDGQ